MASPIRVFTDGACQPNPGKMGIGVVVEWQKNNPTIISKSGGDGTNNIAEYMALLEAQDFIKENIIKNVIINSDSTLMVKQVNGEWKCKDATLKELCSKAQNRMKWFKDNNYKIELVYIPRELNLADTPAKNGVKK
jgi:ribonuclease HI